jgi:hypothetical protein
MASVEEVVSALESVDMDIRFAPHSHRRARQRNVDLEKVKEKIREPDIYEVRDNDEKDPRYEKTYKIALKVSEDQFYEMPIYFNSGGNEIYVKSVWKK